MGVIVRSPGIFTTVQDEGRTGYQQYGVSPSGPMDMRAFNVANILVGNKRTQGALETTFSGPTLVFDQDEVIAVTGANMKPKLNGEPFPMYSAVSAHAGDVLSFSFAESGMHGYIAFAGGLDIPYVMGSQSTLPGKHLGGLGGRKLEAGDRIAFLDPKPVLSHMERRSTYMPVFPMDEIHLRAIPGPQDDAFSEEELKRFFWHSAEITSEYDRMGCRLKLEEPLQQLKDGNIISDGIAFGSVQVQSNGQPIIMMADHQTVGGYTKIATVISADLCSLAQARPGMRVRFIRISIETAQEVYLRDLKKLNELEERMGDTYGMY